MMAMPSNSNTAGHTRSGQYDLDPLVDDDPAAWSLAVFWAGAVRSVLIAGSLTNNKCI